MPGSVGTKLNWTWTLPFREDEHISNMVTKSDECNGTVELAQHGGD